MNKLIVYESFFDNYNLRTDLMLDKKEMTFEEIVDYINFKDYNINHNSVILIYPNDIPNIGTPVDKSITRELFDSNPSLYGVSAYKNINGLVVFM